MTTIRHEQPVDEAAVRAVNLKAFDGPDEATIVEALRANGHALISFVAEIDGRVVGHVMFSPMTIQAPQGTITKIQLAPLAVLPEYQGRSVGSALVWRGLEECRALGYDCVFVLGHRTYYPRFGFTPASRHGIIYEDGRDSFQVVELRPGALGGLTGEASFGPEFDTTS